MKSRDIRDMTVEEIEQRLRETQSELFNLRLQKTSGQIENPLRLRGLRRDVARMKTIIHERRKA
ncbi:MAG: 50S ribosomal protein L29 [Kiritimatiellae bacterium]|nr:50S ribosomal protein L29 [Kiritimatiellia bacterium]